MFEIGLLTTTYIQRLLWSLNETSVDTSRLHYRLQETHTRRVHATCRRQRRHLGAAGRRRSDCQATPLTLPSQPMGGGGQEAAARLQRVLSAFLSHAADRKACRHQKRAGSASCAARRKLWGEEVGLGKTWAVWARPRAAAVVAPFTNWGPRDGRRNGCRDPWAGDEGQALARASHPFLILVFPWRLPDPGSAGVRYPVSWVNGVRRCKFLLPRPGALCRAAGVKAPWNELSASPVGLVRASWVIVVTLTWLSQYGNNCCLLSVYLHARHW